MKTNKAKNLTGSEVADLLVEIGQRLLLAGENTYKARAYSRAAESLQLLAEPLSHVVAQDRLRDIPGVGAALAGVILDLHVRGSTQRLDELRKAVPASVLDMLAIPGLRPPKILALHRAGVSSVEALEAAARSHELDHVKGFGPAFAAQALSAIDLMRRAAGQLHRHTAEKRADRIATAISRAHPELSRLTPAGDLRRGLELVGDLRFVAEVAKARGIERLESDVGADIWLAESNAYGAALVLATGNAEHVEGLRARAQALGFRLTDKGLFRGARRLACKEEGDLYAALQLPFIAPELREGRGEIERAERGESLRLVEAGDLRGVLHCHTNESDGADTLANMAEAARRRGYDYFGLSDHSRAAHYAGGLSIEDVRAQCREVARLNKTFGADFRILHGIESDILEDGSLDYPDDVLADFDFVIASVHSKFKLDRKAQTQRIRRAVENPHTSILGHMTGRMLRKREGYDIDVEDVLRACAEHGVAVEINANPHRLDLDWRWHERALELGCMFSINPDAHTMDELDLVSYGVTMARKGGVPPERVINCLNLEGITELFEARRRSRHRPRGASKRAKG
ncbi:MAG: polymerase/3-5 exonuclease PolX [Hyphomicrobiales bacterium]|nr:polymerase/3-5 exonuclease PolX [Hyphomicrobiales bacterium]